MKNYLEFKRVKCDIVIYEEKEKNNFGGLDDLFDISHANALNDTYC